MTSIPVSLFGLSCEANKSYSQLVENDFKLTSVAIGPILPKNPSRTILTLTVDDKTYTIASLLPGRVENVALDLYFNEGDQIKFAVVGNCQLDIVGNNMLFIDENDEESEEGDCCEVSDEEMEIIEEKDEKALSDEETIVDESLVAIKSKIAGKSEPEIEKMIKSGELEDDDQDDDFESEEDDQMELLFPGKSEDEVMELFEGKTEEEISKIMNDAAEKAGIELNESDDDMDLEELFPGKTEEEIQEMFKGKSEEEVADMIDEAAEAMADNGNVYLRLESIDSEEAAMFEGKTEEEMQAMFAGESGDGLLNS
jgi:hypothetical protein